MTRYLILVLYFAVLFAIGAVAARRVKDYRDFFVGGKRLGYWVVAFSARATGESAWLLLGLTGLGAAVGLSALWVVVGEVIGVAIAWFAMARPFKRATDVVDAVTVPDFLVSRFAAGADPRSRRRAVVIRSAAAGALALFVTIYVSAQIDATGKAFEAFLSWDYFAGVAAGFGIVVLYTMSGGFVAVAWSDLFQGSLMLIGLLAVPIAAWLALEGAPLWGPLRAADPDLVSAGGADVGRVWTIISYLAVGLGFLGSPQVFVRFMSIKSEAEILRGRWIAVAYTLLTDTGAVFTGLLGRRLLVSEEESVFDVLGPGAEQVLPQAVELLFPAVIVGLFIAAVLAAIMSTIDSLLVVASSAVTRDFYQQIWRKGSQTQPLRGLSRAVTLALGLLALSVAIGVSLVTPDRTVFWFVIFGWSGIACTFCPVILLSLFWPDTTYRGALTSMGVGFACVPLFKFVAPALPVVGAALATVGEMAPSFVLALGAGILVSRLDGEAPPEPLPKNENHNPHVP